MKITMLPFLLGVILLVGSPSWGDVFEYTDDSGTVSFTDDPGKIPKKYRPKKKTRREEAAAPSGEVEGRAGGEAQTTSISMVRNQILVPVTVNYRGTIVSGTFLLDTGAMTCTLSPSMARRLGVKSDDGQSSIALGVGGAVVTRTVTLDWLAVGPKKKRDLTASIVPSFQFDGLLGMNFLGSFPHRVDFSKEVIRWGE